MLVYLLVLGCALVSMAVTVNAALNNIENTEVACKCVPYYLCDANTFAVDAYNSSVTGAFKLDVRFNDDNCQESLERCCKHPKEPQPTPAPAKQEVKGCGYRNRQGMDFEVAGGAGTEAQFGEFPWVVAVLDAMDGSYAGVGVLVHPQVVMTGAHIATKSQVTGLKIRAGEWDMKTNKELRPHQERTVLERFIHPEYKQFSLHNNLALLRLKKPVDLASHINIICLPTQDENFDTSRNCVANGWGKDVFGQKGRYAGILKRVELNMVEHSRCNRIMRRTRLGRGFILDKSLLCAGGQMGRDTCQGDGGAPLACPIDGDRYKLTGLVAWGLGCGDTGIPATYVNVAMYRNLINQKMAEWGYDTTANDV